MFSKESLVDSYRVLDNWFPKILNYIKKNPEDKEDKNTHEFLSFCLNLFGWISFKLKNHLKIDQYKSAVSNIVDKTVNYDIKNIKIDDENSLKDHINYIFIWFKNIYNINLKTINLDDIIFNENDSDNKQSSLQAKALQAYRIFDSGNLNNKPLNKNTLSLALKLTREEEAAEQIKKDIESGKIYPFTSKPKLIPILKLFIFLFNIIGILAISFYGMFTIMSGSLSPSFIDVICIWSFIYNMSYLSRSFENEYKKYHFSKNIFISSWISLLALWTLIFLKIYKNEFSNIFEWSSKSICFLIFLFFLILSLISIIYGYYYLNPSEDKKLIKQLEQKYSGKDRKEKVK